MKLAHRYLQSLAPAETPPLETVRVPTLQGRVGGYELRETIFISPTSSFYRAAQEGDLVGLAMLLHHEGYHRTHPAATEVQVLAASLRFCEAHGDVALIDLLLRRVRGERTERTETP